MDEKLYYGRGKDCDNKKLIAFLDEVFFIDDDEETKRDLSLFCQKFITTNTDLLTTTLSCRRKTETSVRRSAIFMLTWTSAARL